MLSPLSRNCKLEAPERMVVANYWPVKSVHSVTAEKWKIVCKMGGMCVAVAIQDRHRPA